MSLLVRLMHHRIIALITPQPSPTLAPLYLSQIHCHWEIACITLFHPYQRHWELMAYLRAQLTKQEQEAANQATRAQARLAHSHSTPALVRALSRSFFAVYCFSFFSHSE